jgi:homocysteine S-methyltransferase
MEAEAIIEAMSTFADAICWISFACKDNFHLCHGETFIDAVSSVVQFHQVVAVGVNCTAPQFVEHLLKSVEECSAGRLLVAYPNSGEQWINSRWQKSDTPSMPLENYVQCWIDAGAKLIGRDFYA